MTEVPKRIWARRHPTGVVEAADYKIEGEQQYHHADLSADLVWAGYKAGLKAAADQVFLAYPEDIYHVVAQVMETDHD